MQPELIELESSCRRDAMIFILNGVLGDHMKASDNPLTIPMSLRHDGNLVAEDWAGRNRFAHFADQRVILQPPKRGKCYAIAAMISTRHSALHGQLMFYRTNYLQLLDSQAVYAQLQRWVVPPPVPRLALAP